MSRCLPLFPHERTPKTLRGSRWVRHFVAIEGLSAIGKRPPKFRHRFDKNGHRVLVGRSVEQTLEFEALDELAPLDENVLVVSLAIFFAAFFGFFGFVAFWYLVRLQGITESVRCRGRDRFNNVVDRIDKLLDNVFIAVAHRPSKFPIGRLTTFADDESGKRHGKNPAVPFISVNASHKLNRRKRAKAYRIVR
jgi:hypothetical protein